MLSLISSDNIDGRKDIKIKVGKKAWDKLKPGTVEILCYKDMTH